MPGEFDLIKRYFAASMEVPRRGDGYAIPARAPGKIVLGPGDDAALLQPTPGCQLVISVDTSVADVHFPSDAPAHAIGHRALAVSASDLAAMGATPIAYTLSLTLPELCEPWVAEFAKGMHTLAAQLGMTLIGGDTTQGPLSVSITVFGEVSAGSALRRDGACSGHLIGVIGTLGGARGGLALWQQHQRMPSSLLNHYLYPFPLVDAGQTVAPYASAGMDVSDGLLADLNHLCRASGVGAQLRLDALPLSLGLVSQFGQSTARDMALSGGDDYALLVTLPEANLTLMQTALTSVKHTLTVIGHTCEESGIVDMQGQPLQAEGWQHFAKVTLPGDKG